MPELLFTISDTFDLPAGLTLAPGVPSEGPTCRVGDRVQIRQPNGDCAEATVSALNVPTPNPQHLFPITVEGITPAQAPPGSEVWLLNSSRGG